MKIRACWDNLSKSVLFIWIFVGVNRIAEACPNCKNAVLEGAEAEASQRLSQGFLFSYILLSGAPFLLIGLISGLLLLGARKKSADRLRSVPAVGEVLNPEKVP